MFKRFLKVMPVLMILVLSVACTLFTGQVRIHYLGHASFFLDLPGKISVLTDYGEKNAYKIWGWDSPIYDAGFPGPDLITYSHFHADHYDSARASVYEAFRLPHRTDTSICGLNILSIPSSEYEVGELENSSYLFSKGKLRILHLGDCQADIMDLSDTANTDALRNRYPGPYDIVFMPIESTQKFIPQAIDMAILLEPRILIPMHYWSESYKQEFIDRMVQKYRDEAWPLTVHRGGCAEYVFKKEQKNPGLTIVDLIPAPRLP